MKIYVLFEAYGYRPNVVAVFSRRDDAETVAKKTHDAGIEVHELDVAVLPSPPTEGGARGHV